jgi:hypothetical protein
MALNQKYLEQLGRRHSQGKDKPKTVSTEQMARVEQAIQEQRCKYQKEDWLASAKWLEENFPQDYAAPKTTAASRPSPETRSSGSLEARLESQPLANAPESPQSAREVLPAPLPIPLPSAFWQALLYGSSDALVSPVDANIALRLVAHELPLEASMSGELSESVRVSAFRKMLAERFGAKVWDVMNKLWRDAPTTPGAPVPNEDQGHCTPGLRECPRTMPSWRREFHQEVSGEQRLLEELGGWCG